MIALQSNNNKIHSLYRFVVSQLKITLHNPLLLFIIIIMCSHNGENKDEIHLAKDIDEYCYHDMRPRTRNYVLDEYVRYGNYNWFRKFNMLWSILKERQIIGWFATIIIDICIFPSLADVTLLTYLHNFVSDKIVTVDNK